MIFFFFFSSRRRHTRYWRDWSSDVCSSDLDVGDPLDAAGGHHVDVPGRVLNCGDEELVRLDGLDLAGHLRRGRFDEHDDVVARELGWLLLGVAAWRGDEDGA